MNDYHGNIRVCDDESGLSIEKESYEWAIIQVYQVSDYTEQNLGYHYCFGPKSK